MNRTLQRGFFGSWGFILCVFGLAIALFIFEQNQRAEGIEHLRNNAPALSAEQVKQIDDYKAKRSPEGLAGMFRGSLSAKGRTFRFSYYFGSDSTLTKTMEVEDLRFSGTAKYSLVGSTLAYSQIQGDKGLFNPLGEAIAVEGNKLVLLSENDPLELVKDAGNDQ